MCVWGPSVVVDPAARLSARQEKLCDRIELFPSARAGLLETRWTHTQCTVTLGAAPGHRGAFLGKHGCSLQQVADTILFVTTSQLAPCPPLFGGRRV